MSASKLPSIPAIVNPAFKEVPKPTPGRRNMSAAIVKEAFNEDYWLYRTGNWEEIYPIENILSLIRRVCKEVLDELGEYMAIPFTFSKQPGSIKNMMYTQFLALYPTREYITKENRDLIRDMLEATDPPERPTGQPPFAGRRWLWEFCMRGAEGQRKVRVKNSQVRRRERERDEVSPGDGSQ